MQLAARRVGRRQLPLAVDAVPQLAAAAGGDVWAGLVGASRPAGQHLHQMGVLQQLLPARNKGRSAVGQALQASGSWAVGAYTPPTGQQQGAASANSRLGCLPCMCAQ